MPEARENAGDKAVVGFIFTPDWLGKVVRIF